MTARLPHLPARVPRGVRVRGSEATLLLALLVPFGTSACANAHDTGEALVAAGTLTALASSEVATRHGLCTLNGCAGQTSKRAAQAAAGVAAGVAMAAVGAALQSEGSGDVAAPAVAAAPTQTGTWRLVRKPGDSDDEPPAYYIEE